MSSLWIYVCIKWWVHALLNLWSFIETLGIELTLERLGNNIWSYHFFEFRACQWLLIYWSVDRMRSRRLYILAYWNFFCLVGCIHKLKRILWMGWNLLNRALVLRQGGNCIWLSLEGYLLLVVTRRFWRLSVTFWYSAWWFTHRLTLTLSRFLFFSPQKIIDIIGSWYFLLRRRNGCYFLGTFLRRGLFFILPVFILNILVHSFTTCFRWGF